MTRTNSSATASVANGTTRPRPVGPVSVAKCAAVTTVSVREEVFGEPTPAQAAWLQLGASGAAAVLADGSQPTQDTLPFQLQNVFSSLARGSYRDGLVRSGVAHARALALAYVSFYQPAGLSFVGAEVADAARQIARCAGDLQLREPAGARLAWSDSDGGELLLDRVTHTHLGGVIRSRWMSPQVAADLTLGPLLTDAFAGVRVFAPKAIFRSVHVLPDGRSHELNGCRLCELNGAWT